MGILASTCGASPSPSPSSSQPPLTQDLSMVLVRMFLFSLVRDQKMGRPLSIAVQMILSIDVEQRMVDGTVCNAVLRTSTIFADVMSSKMPGLLPLAKSFQMDKSNA